MAKDSGTVVGRVAAIINKKANERWHEDAVRFGWLDFIESGEVLDALLEKVEEFGLKHGCDTIIGPLGFTNMDKEGLLVEGYDRLSSFTCLYNYPYYGRMLEAAGYRKDKDWIQRVITVPDQPPAMFNYCSLISERYGLRMIEGETMRSLAKRYGRRIFKMCNDSFASLYATSALSDKQIDKLVNDYIKIADLNLVTAIMDGDKMVGFGITFPSFSKALQKTCDGRLFPFGWWHVLKILKWHQTPVVDLLLIGVLPEYRSKGANALIFDDLIRQFQAYGFEWAETGPQMETNEGVLSQWQYLEAIIHRRHRCYRKLLG